MTFISASSFSSSSSSSSSSSLSSPNITQFVSHNPTEQCINTHSLPESNDSSKNLDNGKESALQRLMRSKRWVLTPPDTDRFRFCFKEPTTTDSLDVPEDNTPIEAAISSSSSSAAAAERKITRIVSYKVDIVNSTAVALCEHSKPKMDTPIKLEDIDVAPASSADPNTIDNDMITLLGHCMVFNLAFEKSVTARYTLDNWITSTDVDATHIESLDDEDYDRFSFTFHIQDFLADDHCNELDIQLALCYRVQDTKHWDNNAGENYHIKVLRSVTLQEDKNQDDKDHLKEQPVMWTQKTSALINDTHISPWTTSRFWIPGYMRHSQMTFAQNNYDIEFLPPKEQPKKDKDEKITTVDCADTEQQEQLSDHEIQ
ncbi:hypothetical protein K492DRAFT_173244 [Lichtheimia hyalospora FSU 10163]|nr:hypothetical protein K492DRAFT_173244 [Lichtheimia hyalospora FSU 10163]